MSQRNSNEQAKASAYEMISKINQVDGFDPEAFAVEFTDLNTGEKSKRLPVVIQIAWFRMVHPNGRIALQVSSGKDCFIATARIYADYHDTADCYLAEATASRGPSPTKPSVSPREWAQTAAIGIALRNAGFGLQFAVAGEEFEDLPSETLGELAPNAVPANQEASAPASVSQPISEEKPVTPAEDEYETVPAELTYEQKLAQAMKIPCPIKKLSDKTLGDLVNEDPKALTWIATKFTGAAEIIEAAKMICEHAVQAAMA